MNSLFKVIPQHLNRIQVRTLARPLQSLHFVFQPFSGGLAGVLRIIVLLQNPSLFQLEFTNRWSDILLQNLLVDSRIHSSIYHISSDIFFSVTDTTKEQIADVCPSVYYISTSRKSWHESRKDCLERGADLLIINSQEEQKFMIQFKRPFWIGLIYAAREKEWKWIDGTLLNTSFWNPGEPNNYRSNDEDCVETLFFDSVNGWNDKNCGHQNFWICEWKQAGRGCWELEKYHLSPAESAVDPPELSLLHSCSPFHHQRIHST
uniref:C-type lectin domain-containing protein n=1 Tax=Cyprinodon variegatus TaxID=28743 RepID=A0A3Q2E260_CYPVA